MPSSSPLQISPIIEIILATKPQSVLDIGIGFGKFGFLCREYLELWDGRDQYNDWRCRIDGIEAFESYITPLQRQIYSNIYAGDALKVVPTLDTYYDLILLVDVIEHFSIEDGQRLLRDSSKCARGCIVSTPLVVSAQKDAFGNPYETHRSQWAQEHFAEFPEKIFFAAPQSLLCYLRFDGVKISNSQTTAAPTQELARTR